MATSGDGYIPVPTSEHTRKNVPFTHRPYFPTFIAGLVVLDLMLTIALMSALIYESQKTAQCVGAAEFTVFTVNLQGQISTSPLVTGFGINTTTPTSPLDIVSSSTTVPAVGLKDVADDGVDFGWLRVGNGAGIVRRVTRTGTWDNTATFGDNGGVAIGSQTTTTNNILTLSVPTATVGQLEASIGQDAFDLYAGIGMVDQAGSTLAKLTPAVATGTGGRTTLLFRSVDAEGNEVTSAVFGNNGLAVGAAKEPTCALDVYGDIVATSVQHLPSFLSASFDIPAQWAVDVFMQLNPKLSHNGLEVRYDPDELDRIIPDAVRILPTGEKVYNADYVHAIEVKALQVIYGKMIEMERK